PPTDTLPLHDALPILEPPARSRAPIARRAGRAAGTRLPPRAVRIRRGGQSHVDHLRTMTRGTDFIMSKTPRHYSPYDAPMWQSIEEGQMKLQRCRQTGTFYYPPGPACPESLSFDVEWAPISGKGKILSWTVFHRQYLPAYPAPHLVVAVALEEGPIMIGY